jgi:hypothetical protein
LIEERHMPQRIWSIEEQVIAEKVTGFVFEFTSAPTEHDDSTMILNVWNESRTRRLQLVFTRGGWCDERRTDVLAMSGAQDINATAGHGGTPVQKIEEPYDWVARAKTELAPEVVKEPES